MLLWALSITTAASAQGFLKPVASNKAVVNRLLPTVESYADDMPYEILGEFSWQLADLLPVVSKVAKASLQNQADQSTRIPITIGSSTYYWDVIFVDEEADSRLLMGGNIDGGGMMTASVLGGQLDGEISLPGRKLIKLTSSRDHRVMAFRIDGASRLQSGGPYCGLDAPVEKVDNSVKNTPNLTANTSADCAVPSSCSAIINVLYLLDNNVWDEHNAGVRNLYNDVRNASNIMNVILINSKIQNKKVTYTIHGSPYRPPGGGGGETDLKNLTSMKSDPGTQSLRNRYKGDMVVYWVKSWKSSGGRAFGIDVSNSEAYCIVDHDFVGLSGVYTTQHELGHLLGGHHQNDFSSSSRCKRAHQVYTKNGVPQHTVMYSSGADPNSDIVQYFSNPAVKLNGYATGVAGVSDVADQISASFCRIAAYQPAPAIELSIGAANPDNYTGCPTRYNLSVAITRPPQGFPGSSGSLSYRWSYSLSPSFATSTQFSSSSAPQLTSANVSGLSPTGGNSVYIKCVVSSSDGGSRSSIKQVTMCRYSSGLVQSIAIDQSDESYATIEANSSVLHVAPNPIHHGEDIRVQIEEPFDGQLEIVSIDGKLLLAETLYGNSAPNEIYLSTTDLQLGMHYLYLRDSSSKVILRTRLVVME